MKVLKVKNLLITAMVMLMIQPVYSQSLEMSKSDLLNKIKGGWAGQVIGCTYGGPTEFRFQSKMIPDDHEIAWSDSAMHWWYTNVPGLYDDIYMDLTFVEIFEKEGLDAPASSFANAFANAEYMLWHANQGARYNILNGIMPPESGHWLYNPHADDIDYQIEADFSGLMAPGMVNTSAEISDKIGHIMNYGDGWYGGVYVGAMYTLAFTSDDVNYVVEEALKVIPAESKYYRCMTDIIAWHKEDPSDWKATWSKAHDKWNDDVGCPSGVNSDFNIDATINSAWVLLGLLYGEMDFEKTLDISTRGGDDSDCNPATAGGILATMIGYGKIPQKWTAGLPLVEDMDFKYTTISLNKTYDMSFRHALQVIEANGGTVTEDSVTIAVQTPEPVALEQGWDGMAVKSKTELDLSTGKKPVSLEIEGTGFAIKLNYADSPWGKNIKNRKKKFFAKPKVTLEVEMYVDGELSQKTTFPPEYHVRNNNGLWNYQLEPGKHKIEVKVLNHQRGSEMFLEELIVYEAVK